MYRLMTPTETFGTVLFSPNGPVRHRTQHGFVVDELGLRVVRGAVKPGESFPPEEDLCASLGVSRGALREAVKALRAKGMVDLRPAKGTRVQPREAWNFLDADVLRWQQEVDAQLLLANLAELRLGGEPSAARLAALRATDDDVRGLREAYRLMAEAVDQGQAKAFNDADVRFHLAVLRASHNELYLSLGRAIEMALRASFDVTATLAGAIKATLPTHEKLLDAISSADPNKAERVGGRLVEEFMEDLDLVQKVSRI